jgi:hypothetical protein
MNNKQIMTELVQMCGLGKEKYTYDGKSIKFLGIGFSVIFTACENEFLKDFPAETKDYVTVGIYQQQLKTSGEKITATLYKVEVNVDTTFKRISELRNVLRDLGAVND